MNYKEFIESKTKTFTHSGFSPEVLNKNLFDFQEFIVRKSLIAGKYAMFVDCGGGKTLMQLAWADAVVNHTGQDVLVLCPLAVSEQTISEGERFGIEVFEYDPVAYSVVGSPQIWIANYEQIENIDTSLFSGVVLDESSILKNFEGQYKKLLIEAFKETPYRLACTATPSPNDEMEICNHAEFLGVKNRLEILAMYFTHDGGETSKWRIKGHAKERFYDFINEWSISMSNPSDLGFDGSKYILPPIQYFEKEIQTPNDSPYVMFNEIKVSATNQNQELKRTMEVRLSEVAKIVNASSESFIVWIKQDIEGEYLRKLIPGAIEVSGSDKKEVKKKHLIGFGRNEFRVMITKSKIARFGLNYQNCRNQVFASPDFSFEALYQCIRRSWRFGQKETVNIWLITTDTMSNVIQSIKRKEKQFNEMRKRLCRITN
jgi:superfamily II DNA or RNA helicase